jgi:hypothetical protein
MRMTYLKAILKTAVQGAIVLLLGAGVAGAQQTINLGASPTTTVLPDGTTVPMWGYFCGTAATTNPAPAATCNALNQAAPTTSPWSPVVITVPYNGAGTSLTINLTNNLSFANASIPTSIMIVGQVGGGLGSVSTSCSSTAASATLGSTCVASPAHGSQTVTWPTANSGPTNVPPPQGPRVQSFGTEVATGATTALTWLNLKPGTYLLESGTHPSIQVPMGLHEILVVTDAPAATAGVETATGCAYQSATLAATCPSVPYDGEVAMEFSEIDPVQNNAVAKAVTLSGFSETTVWSGQPGGCGNPSTTNSGNCYPPAVNYTPLYYMINGAAFNKTNAAGSLFPISPATIAPAAATPAGQVLVRMVNAGLRMHVPSIVGSQVPGATGGTNPIVTGFKVVAEDGNPLPGVPKIRSEIFMAAGKVYDVLINGLQTASPGATPTAYPSALPIFDRELSLSANATGHDAGMLGYIGVNPAAAIPAAPGFGSAVARADNYPALVAGQSLTVSDPGKGVIANDSNVYGVQLLTQATSGTVTLNANGTFTYVPSGTATSDSFSYCANGSVTAGVCSSGISATVSLAGSNISDAGVTCSTYSTSANTARFVGIRTPGVLAGCTDGAGLPLTQVIPAGGAIAGTGGMTVYPDVNGGFTAVLATPCAVTTGCSDTFSFQATNSHGAVSGTTTATVNFPKGSGLVVNVLDGQDKTTQLKDYRWVIEEDKTFHIDPNCSTNPPAAGCPTAALGIVPTLGTNFHTSHMPYVAQGCTGSKSCEVGQTVLGQAAICDLGNGGCRTGAQAISISYPDGSSGAGKMYATPADVLLDPTKRYYISILPGDAANPFTSGYAGGGCQNGSANAAPGATCGHGMGGAPIPSLTCTPTTTCTAPTTYPTITVITQPAPYPPGKLSVMVFEDDFPLNGEQDGGGGVDVLSPIEPGLGQFQIHLWDAMGGNGDFTGQMTYDMFNQPLTNSLAGTLDPNNGNDACPVGVNELSATSASAPTTLSTDPTATGITGMVVTCPKYESDGVTLSPLSGQAIIANLMPGRWGVIATPGADRVARGEEWLQTNTLDGQKAHDVFTRIGEPSYFQEYGPASFHVVIGFANPQIINDRRQYLCNGTDPFSPQVGVGYTCNNTLTGKVTGERLSRTPDERLYSSGSHDAYYWSQCYASFGDPDGEDFAFTKCDSDGNFTLTGLPPGDWRLTIFDQWNDLLVDGLSTPVAIGPSTSGQTVNIGDVASTQWETDLYTRTFVDDNADGISQSTENGIPFANVAVRLRDGSLENLLVTDFTGTANFNETFPLFSWYVVETDVTRYKNTGTHAVYDVGGPADGSASCGTVGYPPCGTSTIGKYLANTAEIVSVPTNLRVPGSVYCAGADCTGKSIQNGGTSSDPPSSCTTSTATPPITTCATQLSSGRIDNPWTGGVEGWQGFPGQNSFLEFGKEPYADHENGGIKGHVVYASTRPFDDPMMLVQTQWTPLVPNVTINLYQEGFASDNVTPTLTLVDTTTTSSFDDYAQGFRADGVTPNMNCPGQGASSGVIPDLFFFSLYNQPNYLNFYANQHGGPAVQPLPNNSQFKCYDGMHNWNQLQPAPYDGMYKFPSVTAVDSNGKPLAGKAGTNCTICVPDPVASPDLYAGIPMLPPGKYVVEAVLPPGFELVKEEDKNILIGDNFIAPVTQEFGGLGNIFIIPDQASVASSQQYPGPSYNANNAQNPTTSLGTTPQEGIVPGFIPEPVWPCVGEMRIVPDYISLYPWSHQVSPFAGASRPLCDRKEVTLTDQMGAIAKFYIYTSTHIASKFTGGITDDYTSEFDPFSPQFGEKFAPPDLPVSVKDWAGNEISRVYADHWGSYDGMTYSTWEVNPPNPTGYSPTMMIFCMNDPGPIPNPSNPSQMITDPSFTPGYSQFCYELPFMPGTTQYLDTPVVPTSAFAGAGYNNVDCAYPALTPAIAEVDGDGVGPWVGSTTNGAVISVTVQNPGSGYTGIPGVTISGGTGATATAVISGSVKSVSVTTGGIGYTSAPAITFTGGGGGSGATATANMTGSVASVSIATSATYSNTPTVTFSAPTGGVPAGAPAGTVCTTATGTAVLSRGTTKKVTSVTINNAGSCYTSAPTIKFSGTGTTTATVNMAESVLWATLSSGGQMYNGAPTPVFSAPTSGTAATGTTTASGSVIAVNIVTQGTGYTAPTVAIAAPAAGGTQATATATSESSGGTLTIKALGDQVVPNHAYSGPSATTAPFNTKTITRHYGFGTSQGTGSVTIGGVTATVKSWGDQTITVTVPPTGSGTGKVNQCLVQQQQQYGGSTAYCGELVVTSGNGMQSVDAVTVTVGGKAPTHVAASASIQSAIDAAAPGDLIIVDPTCATTGATPAAAACSASALNAATPTQTSSEAQHSELLLMWKPVRLQGVGSASSVINANTHPAGKLDAWRQHVVCLFGLSIQGTPLTSTNAYDPSGQTSCPAAGWNYFVGNYVNAQVDPLPLEAIVGWDASQNGNLAQLLQEPTLMGALEGAGITVLGKGVNFPTAPNVAVAGGELGGFPTGTTLLQTVPAYTDPVEGDVYPASTPMCTSGPGSTNPFPSNYMCNPSSIDGLGITQSSQGGGAIYIHGWGHNLQVANNHIWSNAGTLSGGINLGQGEFAPSYISGSSTNAAPYSCTPAFGSKAPAAGVQLPYCQNVNVNIHNNNVSLNSSTGDELFSGTPAGAGGVSICTGADYYMFNYNWVCGNLSSGDGGGVGHMGFSYNGTIAHNTIIFNQSLNPTIPANGGGLLVMGTPDVDTTCGGAVDIDCLDPAALRTPSDGIGPNLVINANLIMGNAAESGSGGGLRFQNVNGGDVLAFPTTPAQWYAPMVTNNIITDNVAGWDGGGISLLDTLDANIINNTIAANSTTASAGVLFTTIGAPLASSDPTNTSGTSYNCIVGSTTSCPQPAGLVSVQNSSSLVANLPANVTCPANHYQGSTAKNGTCTLYSYPLLENNIFWQNSAYNISVGAMSPQYQQNVITLVNAGGTAIGNQPQADATAANGTGSVTITGGTGACLSTAQFWDIGVRGDTGPTNHGTGVTLNPTYSVITSIAGYPTTNTANAPNFVSQYCDGARTPPEFGASGWSVPAGISDATVPNPIFNLSPVATVDEGNNWINLRWGPLSMVNPATSTATSNVFLGNYSLASSSPIINFIPTSEPNYNTLVPKTDFFGNKRPDEPTGASHIDPGAVEYIAVVTPASVSVSPTSLSFTGPAGGATTASQTLTLTNSGGSAFAVTLAFTQPPSGDGTFARATGGGGAGGTCTGSLAANSTCTINIVFTPGATVTSPTAPNGSLAIAGITNGPVSLTGTDTVVTHTATVSPSPLAFGNWATGTTGSMTLTVTNTGNGQLTGGTFTGLTAPFTRPTGGAGGTCGATLNVGASCTIIVRYAPTATGLLTRSLAVAYAAGATVTGSPVTVSGTGVGTKAAVAITPAAPITIAHNSSGTVTLTNNAAAGGSSVAVTNVAVTGASLTLTNIWAFTKGTDTCTGANLAPGASCTVQVNLVYGIGTPVGSITFTDTGATSPSAALN